MRVLIISDTHGRHTAFDRAIMEAGKIDYLVHLGDTEGGEDYIEAFCGCPAYILAGNNDFFSRNLREMEIYFGKKKAFMAHLFLDLFPDSLLRSGQFIWQICKKAVDFRPPFYHKSVFGTLISLPRPAKSKHEN